MKFLDLKYDAFGLDINDSSVKIAMLEKKKGSFLVSSFGRENIKSGVVEAGIIKDEKALTEAIKSLYGKVKGKKIKSKYAVISLPEEESFLQVIQMPKMTLQELKSAIVFEAENHIPLPIDQVYLDFEVIEQAENINSMDVLVAATPKYIVDSYVSCVKAAGLMPVSAEIESQSIVRALAKNESNEFPLVLIDAGRNNIDFIVFSNRAIRFTYSIPISQNQLTETISKAMKISFGEAEKMKIKYGLEDFDKKENMGAKKIYQAMAPVLDELSSQITKYIDFYQDHSTQEHSPSAGKIKKVILSGGGSNLKKLPEFLSKKLGIPVEVGSPLINLTASKKKFNELDAPSFTAAFGLAIAAFNIEKELTTND